MGSILVSDKKDFKTKSIRRDKEGPSNSTCGYLSKETQNAMHKLKTHMHFYVHCSITYSSHDVGVSIYRQMDKEDAVHVYKEILLLS